MQNNFPSHLLIVVLTLCSCSGAEKENYKFFTDKKAQAATERIVGDLVPVDSLNMTEAFYGSSLSLFKLNNAYIFGKLDDQIVRLNKQDLSRDTTFMLPQGRGPGEIIDFSLARFDVGNQVMAVYDSRAKKTVLYDLNGNFRKEFLNDGYSVAGMAMADEQKYYFLVRLAPEYLFYEVKQNKNKSSPKRKFQQTSDEITLLAYSGSMVYHNKSLYFGGYSEPLIRGYDLSKDEVKPLFSRAVIQDYDSKNNYEEPRQVSGSGEFSGGGRFWSWAEEAKYASRDIAADDNYLYSVRHHNDTEGYKYLDVYATKNGDYQGSFELQYYPSEIAVDEQYIYTLEAFGSTRYLVKYRKPEMNF